MSCAVGPMDLLFWADPRHVVLERNFFAISSLQENNNKIPNPHFRRSPIETSVGREHRYLLL
jgi:hypothetical protein